MNLDISIDERDLNKASEKSGGIQPDIIPGRSGP